MPADPPGAVLHYVGYDVDRGGILAVIRALAAEKQFPCVLGVNPGFEAQRSRELALLPLPAVAGDTISVGTALRAHRVARAVRTWLHADASRVFHGHSRAGLLVAWWLRRMGERRVVATVHCYGRRRWFYRSAARRLRGGIHWLSPAMKHYYGVADGGWSECLPPCIPASAMTKQARQPKAGGTRFGCVGALVPVKQWELALEALARVPHESNVRVVHAGSEDGTPAARRYADRLRAQAAQLELAGRFELRGEVSDMPAFFREIDCLLIPSRREAFSVAALEAAAANVPCLAADAAGNHDLMATGRLGWTFLGDSASDCATKMLELTTDGRLAAWRRDDEALRRFTAPVSAAQHAALYRRLLDA